MSNIAVSKITFSADIQKVIDTAMNAVGAEGTNGGDVGKQVLIAIAKTYFPEQAATIANENDAAKVITAQRKDLVAQVLLEAPTLASEAAIKKATAASNTEAKIKKS